MYSQVEFGISGSTGKSHPSLEIQESVELPTE